jgi:hypothetical protein
MDATTNQLVEIELEVAMGERLWNYMTITKHFPLHI